MSNRPPRQPMKLYLVFLLGFLASVATVGGLIWLLAAYETKDLNPFFHSPRMSQDKWFEIIRNAVTMGAALGVGVTLFFSYRRQQTAEETQRIGIQAQLTAAKAQQTAAEALELANKQHGLDQDRRKDSVTAELRSRYVQTAEQLGSEHLAIKLAGIYSLAALADDWAEIGNHDERQVCIDLLSAYFRYAHYFDDSARAEVMATLTEVILSRLKHDTSVRKHWGGANIDLSDPQGFPSVDGLVLRDRGTLTLRRPSGAGKPLYFGDVVLDGGILDLQDVTSTGAFTLFHAALNRGQLRVSLAPGPGDNGFPVVAAFNRVILSGATLVVNANQHKVTFDYCTFKSGNLFVSSGRESVTFRNCVFEGNVFGYAGRMGAARPVSTGTLIVENCRFEEGVEVLESYEIDPATWQATETYTVDQNGTVHRWRADLVPDSQG
ncbi:hypothetical protein KNN17_08055 [Arthrobacter bambusae]|uniref:hypothetical protein n=1 Tax=Arthrobacter bambusae TaxID=1338426 RepID=UPI001F50FA84|nr:hypothetical protein [Arthrobacter bambusae]MCI0141532.1 hypothetical protein [Arthrobacter bambusae]